uniref:Ovule protein n=1 Tax=Steinernema glaseri TaxID=37863 RepID=A0A1I8A2D7_9BILA
MWRSKAKSVRQSDLKSLSFLNELIKNTVIIQYTVRTLPTRSLARSSHVWTNKGFPIEMPINTFMTKLLRCQVHVNLPSINLPLTRADNM